jgi:Chalcone isomerase-like
MKWLLQKDWGNNMKRRFDMKVAVNVFLICLLSVVMVSVNPAFGKNIAGVDVPQTVTIENQVLVLNGAGIRKKYFFKIYVGALYLSVKRTTVNAIINDAGAKRIVMSFLYKELSTEDLVDGWNEGFAGNNSAKEMKSLQDRINKFNSLFTTVRKGDEIQLDYLPGEGTQVRLNGVLKGSVPGEDFSRAVLKIWLGSKPADANLKDAMLGNSY